MDLRELGSVRAELHWYYVSKSLAIIREVRQQLGNARKLLDVGAGSGFFTRQLVDAFDFQRVIAYDPLYSSDQAGIREGIDFRTELKPGDMTDLDLVSFIDVLEHVDNPTAFLRDFVEGIDKGATVVITVPAFMFLWSSHDEFLGHYHRYRLRELTRVVEDVGLKVISSRYLFCTILPIVLLRRKLFPPKGTDLTELPSPLNRVLRSVCSIEHRVPWLRIPGLSALVVATK